MRKILIGIVLSLAVLSYTPAPFIPLQLVMSQETEQAGDPAIKVWVNTPTKVYHCPESRWYGKTKKGEYMTQKEAQEKGYRPAGGKACE